MKLYIIISPTPTPTDHHPHPHPHSHPNSSFTVSTAHGLHGGRSCPGPAPAVDGQSAEEEVDDLQQRQEAGAQQEPEGAAHVAEELQQSVTELLLHFLEGHGGQVQLQVHEVVAPVVRALPHDGGELGQEGVGEGVGGGRHAVQVLRARLWALVLTFVADLGWIHRSLTSCYRPGVDIQVINWLLPPWDGYTGH